MKKFNSKELLGMVVLLIVLTGGSFIIAKQFLWSPTKEDIYKAEQLTQIAGMDSSTILHLYKASRDWDKVTRNIAVYRQILAMAEGTPAEKQFYKLIPKYEAADLFVAYDYFSANGLLFNKVTGLLAQRAQGGEWDNILAEHSTGEYNNYRVLDKEDLRQLLDSGYLPDDILQADNIARVNDLDLQYVLQLKNEKNTWEDVAVSLGAEKEPARTMRLSVPGVDREIDNPSTLPALSAQKTKEQLQEAKISVTAELGLTDEQIEAHLSQGFNPWEVRNAYKLAWANGVSAQEILDKKNAGRSWEEILATYPLK